MPAVPPSPTRSSHSSRSSASHHDGSDHDDGEVHSLSSQSDHEHPSHAAQGYSSSDDWSASDAEQEQDDFDLVASRDLRGSVSGASSEGDEAGEGKMRLSYPDPMARDSDHDEDSHSSRSEELLVSHDAREEDLASSLVGGDYSLLLDVSPASPVSTASASCSVPPLPPLSPAPSQQSSSTSAALHAWLRSTSSPSSPLSSTSDAHAHPHPVLRQMSSEEKTDQAVQASFPEPLGGEKSVVLESMGSSAATVVPGSSVVMSAVAGAEEKRAVEVSKEEATLATIANDKAVDLLDAPPKPTKTTDVARSRTCTSARQSRDAAPPDLTWTLGAILALCIGLWVAGSHLSTGRELASLSAAVSTVSPASHVEAVSSAVVPAPSTSAIDRTAEPVTSSSASSVARTAEPIASSSASPVAVSLSTKSWTSLLGLGSAPVRSTLPAAPEVARVEGGGVKSGAEIVKEEVRVGEASESASVRHDKASAEEPADDKKDDKADRTSPFLLDAPEEAFKDFFSTSHMRELQEWFVAAGQRSSRRFQQDAQEILAHLAKMRASLDHHQPSTEQISNLRLPGFNPHFGVNHIRSRFADLSAVSTAHADQVLRSAARSLDHLHSTSSHALSHLSPILDSTVTRLKAGTRFSESRIKRAAWTAQVLERRVRWILQGGAEKEYPKLCGCPFA